MLLLPTCHSVRTYTHTCLPHPSHWASHIHDLTVQNKMPFMMKTPDGMKPWYDAIDIEASMASSAGLVSWLDLQAEFATDLGVHKPDIVKYGWSTAEITQHHNYLIAVAGLSIQALAGKQEQKTLGAIMESQLLQLAWAYTHRTGTVILADTTT